MKPPTITIPFSRPSIGVEEYEAVRRVLESGWLTTGKEATLFETEVSDILSNNTITYNTKAVQSATAGLHLCLKACGIGTGDTVITTPLTFVSSASSILYTGATPIFVDCKKNCIYPDEYAFETILKNTNAKAWIPVHIAGCASDNFTTLLEIAKHAGVFIIEDAAHAFPAYYETPSKHKTFLGTMGDAGVFSFYANKTITTAEGGMIACADKTLAQKISTLRNHGIDRTVWDRFNNAPLHHEYDIQTLGYKYNLPDILAAIGREQLKKSFLFQEKRRAAAEYYCRRLSECEYLSVPTLQQNQHSHSWHLFIIRITHPTLSRNDFIQKLAEHGIGTSVHYKPLPMMTYYQKTFGYTPAMFPHACEIYEQIMSLPLYPDIQEEELEKVCNTIIQIGDAAL